MPDNKSAAIAYGVWITGSGWLRNPKNPNAIFADTSNAVAQSAAFLYGDGARVTPIDDELIALEPTFLERDTARARERHAKTWRGKLARLRGLLR